MSSELEKEEEFCKVEMKMLGISVVASSGVVSSVPVSGLFAIVLASSVPGLGGVTVASVTVVISSCAPVAVAFVGSVASEDAPLLLGSGVKVALSSSAPLAVTVTAVVSLGDTVIDSRARYRNCLQSYQTTTRRNRDGALDHL